MFQANQARPGRALLLGLTFAVYTVAVYAVVAIVAGGPTALCFALGLPSASIFVVRLTRAGSGSDD